METNSQHFIKIEIKGDVKNLPKETGIYAAHYKDYVDTYFRSAGFNNDPIGVEYWLENIDAYLLPVPEPQQPEQTESAELNPKYKALIEIYAMLLTGLKLTKDEAISELTKLISSILEDVSQSPSKAVIMPKEEDVEKEAQKRQDQLLKEDSLEPECIASRIIGFVMGAKWFRSHVREVELKSTDSVIVGPTEEEIRKWAYANHNALGHTIRMCFEEGANWYRSQLKTVNLKGELVKFWTWVNKGEIDSYATRPGLVDDYLSARKEGE